MVNWCENCGAFLGLCKPISDWTTKRIAYCQQCAPEPSLRLRAYLTMNPHASSGEVVIALARVGTRVNERMVDYVKQFLPMPDAETVMNGARYAAENEGTVLSN